MTKTVKETLTSETLKRLENFYILLHKKIESQNASGIRKSQQKGVSMEFSDFRNYTLGDDLRRVDWNSYARFGRLFLKLFMEEKQAHIHIFLDNSASMAFDEKKCLQSKLLCAFLTYIAVKGTDKVTLFALNAAKTGQKKSLQSKNNFMEAVSFLDQMPFTGETFLNQSIKNAAQTISDGGISVVISDFFSHDGYEEAVKYLQYKKQEILLLQILSKEEQIPALSGSFTLKDCENKEEMQISIDENIRAAYAASLAEYQKKLAAFALKRGAHFSTLSSEEELFQNLQTLLLF